MTPKQLFDRLLVGGMSATPNAFWQHLLHLLRLNPSLPDRWGYHIRPIQYYEPLPDFRQITPAATTDRRRTAALSETMQLPDQLARLQQLAERFGGELAALAAGEGVAAFDFRNDYFANFDAAVYYCLIRDLRPRRVIEIGSGYSTRIADAAMRRNRAEGSDGELICIEPYPRARLTEARLQIRLIQQRVEEVDLALFEQLDAGDILLIDSSHVATFGSDVCREFLEILPRLRTGVWVHVHDIFFPYDYPADWLIAERRSYNEQYLLQAFLSFNAAYETTCALHWLWVDHRQQLIDLWPPAMNAAGGPSPSSFWMKRNG